MTLLQEIIDGASGNEPVTSLLRKVKVVAARAGVPVMEEWVGHELNGYPEEAALPDYRAPSDAQAFGHFVGPFQSQMNGAPIAGAGFPKDLDFLFEIEFRQSISEIEALSSGDRLQSPWPADLVAHVNGLLERGELTLYGDHRLLSAWRSVSGPQLISIVDAVRTRVLDLALTMEKTSPDAGQVGADKLAPKEKQVITTHIYGDNTNVAVASAGVSQSVTINRGDRDALRSTLTGIGLPEEMVESLFEALEKDENSEGQLGPATRGWLATAMETAADLGIGASAGLIANAIFGYLGLSYLPLKKSFGKSL